MNTNVGSFIAECVTQLIEDVARFTEGLKGLKA
jgi:hypothetical protein